LLVAGWSDDFQALNVPSLWEDYNPQGVGSVSVSGSILTISVPRDTVDRFRGLFSVRALPHPEFEILVKLKWNVPGFGVVECLLAKDITMAYRYYFYYYGGYGYYLAKIIGGSWTGLASYSLVNNAPAGFEYWRFRYRRGLMVWERSTAGEYGPWTRLARVSDRALTPPFRLALVVLTTKSAPAGSTSYLYVDWVKVSHRLPHTL
jgi:hypothetical protein